MIRHAHKLGEGHHVIDVSFIGKEDALEKGYHFYVGKICKNNHENRIRDVKYDYCRNCVQKNIHKRQVTANGLSKMIEIDHLLEQRAELAFIDKYYYMED